MERDDVRAAVEIVEGGVQHVVVEGVFRIGIGVVGDDVHAETLQNADQHPGDPARADDSRRAAVQVEPEQPVQREVAVPRAPVGTVYLTVQRQHQGHGVLRYGMGRVSGYTDHGQAVFCGCLQVYVVEPGASQGQQPDTLVGQRPDRSGIGRVVHEDAGRLVAAGQDGAVRVEVAFVVVDVEFVFLVDGVERFAVVGLGSEKGDFHVGSHLGRPEGRVRYDNVSVAESNMHGIKFLRFFCAGPACPVFRVRPG